MNIVKNDWTLIGQGPLRVRFLNSSRTAQALQLKVGKKHDAIRSMPPFSQGEVEVTAASKVRARYGNNSITFELLS